MPSGAPAAIAIEGVRRHAAVVAVDVRRIQAAAPDSEPRVLAEQQLAIQLAEHRVALLAGLEEGGAILVSIALQALRGVARRA
jgi:hypothetical protein